MGGVNESQREHQHGSSCCRSVSLQIFRRGLACLSISNNVESDLLSFVEGTHASAFDRADVHEHILTAVIRLDEAEAFRSLNHFTVPCVI
jgi:hypothetical protein